MTLVAEKYGSSVISNEMVLAKFHKIAKDHFQLSIKNDTDQLNVIKENIRFFSLELPTELKEIFISFNDAPLFWIYESSLLTQIEEFMKFNFKGMSFIELHKQIKESYSRWATTKLKSEKEYYSTTTINFIERDITKHNFFKMILKGIIFAYQPSYYNPVKALEIFHSTLDLINSLRLNDYLKSEMSYILKLYIGFVYLKENDNEKANLYFKEAIEIKPQGCTAIIYSALTEVNLGDTELALYHLKEVINYDIKRLSIALKFNNLGMLNYFFKNPFIYNIFLEKDFAKVSDSIQTVLQEFRIVDETALQLCKENVEKIKLKKMEEYYDDEIKKSLQFSEKLFAQYSTTQNTLFFAAYSEFKAKVSSIIEKIVQNVKEKYYLEVKSHLSSYDLVINDNISAEKHLLEELESYKEKSSVQLKNNILNITQVYDTEAADVERKINDLPNIDKYNPRVAFSNNMTYNAIIAFVVFIIGGFTGYSNNGSEFNSMLTNVVISGSKWGAISFLVGLIISFIMTGAIIMERYDVRARLIRKLSMLKNEKERMIIAEKESAVHKDKIMSESINGSVELHRQRVKEVREQRAKEEKEQFEKANQLIEEITIDLILLQGE